MKGKKENNYKHILKIKITIKKNKNKIDRLI